MPLYARALETRRKRPLLADPKAVEIVDSIDWDFQRIAQPRRMAGCVLRGTLFDVWVRDFLQRHPDGTVVEIGAGLTRASSGSTTAGCTGSTWTCRT